MPAGLLIATNGAEESWPAVEYGAWLASQLRVDVILFGVVEHLPAAAIDEQHPLEAFFGRAVAQFQENRVSYRLEVQNGPAESLIPRRAKDAGLITVLGRLGRSRLRHMLAGRSIAHLLAAIEGPIVYVPQARIPVKRLLISLGGLGYELTAEHLAIQVAKRARAEIALLHVIPPMDLDYPTARLVRTGWRHLDDTNTPIGRSIRKAMAIAQEAGLSARVIARQGLVVEEILAEVREGGHDLLCLGSAHSASAMRQLYTPDVTSQIAEAIDCPILTARFRPEPSPSDAGSEL